MRSAKYRSNQHLGFTLTEVLVATFLLNLSMAAIVTLWRLSARITERSRDTAEYYVITRREGERTRAYRYNDLFFNAAYASGVSPSVTTPYNEDGDTPSAARPARYQASSTFYRRQTGAEDEQRQLGIQIIDVYRLPRSSGDTPVYSTTLFFTVGGV